MSLQNASLTRRAVLASSSPVVSDSMKLHFQSCAQCTILKKSYCYRCQHLIVRTLISVSPLARRFELVRFTPPLQRSRLVRATSFAVMTSFIIYASRNEAPFDYETSPGAIPRPQSTQTPSALVNKLLRLANFTDALTNRDTVSLAFNDDDDITVSEPAELVYPLALLHEPSVLIDSDNDELLLQLTSLPSDRFSLPTVSQSLMMPLALKSVHIEMCPSDTQTQPDTDTTDAQCSATVFSLAMQLLASYTPTNFDRHDSLNLPDFLDLVKPLVSHQINYDPSDASSSLAMIISFASKLHREYELKDMFRSPLQQHACMYQPCILSFAQEYFELHPSFYSNHIVNPTQFLHCYVLWSHAYYSSHRFTLTFIKEVVEVINDVASYKDYCHTLRPSRQLVQINTRKLRSLHFEPTGQPIPLVLDPLPTDYEQ
jgi:hypothetical protein